MQTENRFLHGLVRGDETHFVGVVCVCVCVCVCVGEIKFSSAVLGSLLNLLLGTSYSLQ